MSDPVSTDAAPRPLDSCERRPNTGPGWLVWLRWAWRKLASMRTALVLLLLLAVAAIPGSVFPQRGTQPGQVDEWLANNPTLGPIIDRLGLFDVFAAPWFAAIYLLLMVSLTGCVVPRAVATVRALRSPIAAPPGRSTRFAQYRELRLSDASEAATVFRWAGASLRRGRWRVRTGSEWVVAEKGVWGEIGNLLFHMSLLLVLLGVAVGSMWGWRGTVVLREGAGFANTRAAYDTFEAGRFVGQTLPPFRFDLRDFSATFEREGSQRGSPRSFRADLSVQATPTESAIDQVVAVNRPLLVSGSKVFLIGHGYAPHLRITDSAGSVVFDDTVVFVPHDGNFTSVGVAKAPDAEPPLAFEGAFLPTAAVDPVAGPRSSFPAPDDPALFLAAWTGDLGMDSGNPVSVFELDTSGLNSLGVAALRIGETMNLPDGAAVTFVGFDRWASFTVAHDPGKALALVAGIMALLGLSLSLLLRRRRIWVRATPSVDNPNAATLEISGWERRASDRLGSEVDLLVDQLVQQGAIIVEPTDPLEPRSARNR